MKRFVCVFITIAVIVGLCANGMFLQATGTGEPSVTVSKSVFEYGEDITVTYKNIDQSLLTGNFVSIAIFKQGDVVGRQSSKAEHRVWHKDASIVTRKTPNATVSYPEADNGRNGTNFPLPVGAYYVCIRQDNTVIGEIAPFEVVAAQPGVSVSKAEFTVGEDITVTYKNITQSLLTGNFVSIAIFKKGDVVGRQSSKAEHRVWHKDASIVTSKTPNATVSYPDADNGRNGANFPLPAGEYYVCIRQDNTVIGEIAEFKVVAAPSVTPSVTPSVAPSVTPSVAPSVTPSVAPSVTPSATPGVAPSATPSVAPSVTPSLTLSKTEFTVGEDITVTYKNVEESLLDGKTFVSVAIFKAGDEIGKQSSKAEHRIWHKDASVVASNTANATVSYPDADNGRNGTNFPLPAGEYYMCIRQDNTIVGEIVTFTVRETNMSTGDANLVFVCSIFVICIGGIVAFRRKSKIEN